MSDTPEHIYICPACGRRYDEPTACATGHPPTDAIEYDRATVEAADNGDTDAAAAVAKIEADNAGVGAGTVIAEATPGQLTVPPPVPAEPVAPSEPFVPFGGGKAHDSEAHDSEAHDSADDGSGGESPTLGGGPGPTTDPVADAGGKIDDAIALPMEAKSDLAEL